MSEESIVKTKAGELYKAICQSEWNPTVTGVVIAFLSVMMMAWWRPWGAVGALRNWGDWIMYWLAGLLGTDAGIFAFYEEAPRSVFIDSGSIIGIGFIGGAFISACLGKDFAFRIPPYREMVKAIIAGILMGVGASLAGGCNVGGSITPSVIWPPMVLPCGWDWCSGSFWDSNSSISRWNISSGARAEPRR